MARDVGLSDNPFFKAALAEAEGSEAILQWVQDRAATVQQMVEAHDVLRHFGIQLRYPGGGHEEQIPCPFHGKDNRPSCRVYPRDAESPSHTWCFTCQEWLDVVGLWRKFRGLEKYTHALHEIEKAYGITTPEPPLVARRKETESRYEEVMRLHDVAERRLVSSKPAFKSNMKAYLTVGCVLDRLASRLESRAIQLEVAEKALRQVLAKVAEKERAWGGE